MKLSFSLVGSTQRPILRCVEGQTPVAHRLSIEHDAERVGTVSTQILAVLERGNRARTFSSANLADLKAAGEELARLLLPGPVLSRIRSTMGSLSLELDTELAPIPWELLYDGEQFLCRRFDLGRLLVADWHTEASVRRPATIEPPVRMLVIGADPRGDLARVADECDALIEILDPHREKLSVRMVRAQDREAVRRALKEYDVVHFAGHADYDPTQPDGAGWHLSDGKLMARTIADMGAARPMPHVVFSNACQTGLEGPWVPERAGRVLGLASSFLRAGVRHYVGTQWELVDGIGADVSAHFYAALVRGANMGAAMRSARARLVEERGEESLGWATYVLYGSPTYIPIPAQQTTASAGTKKATARLGVRATLPWKKNVAPPVPGETDPQIADAEPAPVEGWPPWLVAGVMVLFLLAAAALGAVIYAAFS